MQSAGIDHLTAISANPCRKPAFYNGLLDMRPGNQDAAPGVRARLQVFAMGEGGPTAEQRRWPGMTASKPRFDRLLSPFLFRSCRLCKKHQNAVGDVDGDNLCRCEAFGLQGRDRSGSSVD